MFSYLAHLFVPGEKNNHRPKLLHHKSIFTLLLLIAIATTFVSIGRKTAPSILGIATNIVIEDLLSYTNQERQKEGIPPVVLNKQLSDAATAKAVYMFDKNYWAHNAPDGTTPWVFIQKVGYDYVYAGENLAKDFNDSEGVVKAWMASPSHKENMLSQRYDEIGFAIVNGTLNGQETTLVVEMFGRRQGTQAAAGVGNQEVEIPATPAAVAVAGVANKPLIDSSVFTKQIAIGILATFVVAFVLDLAYVERRKLFRLVGHNIDHILFLIGAILILIFFGRGLVL